MSRIFDALKKSRTPLSAAVEPAMVPTPAVTPMVPVGPPSIMPMPASPASRSYAAGTLLALPRVEIVRAATLPEDLARELSALRVNLESAFEGLPSRVVMLLSSQRGEGTSTVAWRFASLLATESGRRVLLADLHARRSSLSERLERGEAPSSGHATDGELSVLPLSAEARERGVLTASSTRPLIAALAGSYDWVVLDGPPVLESPDAVELAALADGVVLVVQAGSAKRPVVSRAAEMLRKGGGRVLGSVLNRRRLEIPEFIYRRI